MDGVDLKILKILQKKARIPNVEVAREIKMAPSAVLERIKKLEAQNIISGYEVILNSEHFHRSMIAFVQISLYKSVASRETGELLAELEAVQEVHYLAGRDCLMIKVRVADMAELEGMLRETIGSLENVKSTETFVALATYKETSRIPLTEA